MDALVMCGGRGTRLGGDVEKPLVEVGGVPMLARVVETLDASPIDRVRAVVSPQTPATRAHLVDAGRSVLTAPGKGYVADLNWALARVEPPVLTVAADLPLLAPDAVDTVLDAADGSIAVCVPVELKRRLGVSVETTVAHRGRELAPTGVNVVDDSGDTMYVTEDTRLAVNVNRPTDLARAEALCE